MKIIDYQSDEKSVKDIYYVMGPSLYEFVKKVQKDKRNEHNDELRRLRNHFQQFEQNSMTELIPSERRE